MGLIRLYILIGLGLGTAGEYVSPYYARRVMDRVAYNRGMEIVPCMIASPTIPIGEWVWVWGKNTHTLRYCRVTDTSARRDKARHIRMRRVELSWEAALSLCGAAAMKDRPEACEIIVFRINE